MVGRGAEVFASQHGVATVDPSYFWTQERWNQYQQRLKKDRGKKVGAGERLEEPYLGTVGAVALDRHGTLAAGTSGYGLCVGSGGSDTGRDSTTPVGAAPSPAGPFGGSCSTSSHAVGGLTTSAQTVWSVSDPTQNAFVRLFVKAAISTSVPSRNDYTDVLTFIAAATY